MTPTSSRTRIAAFLMAYRQQAVLIALLCGVLIAAARLSPGFLSAAAQWELSTHIWEPALLAIPMTLIILTAGIDLSVGSTMALSAVVFGIAFHAGAPLWLSICAGLAVGTAAGWINGFFTARIMVHPLIVTLATMAAYRGIAEGISHGRSYETFPAIFTAVGRGAVAGIPVPALIFALYFGCVAFAMARTTLGISLRATGYNEVAARYSGIPTARLKMLLYTVSGATAALCGLLFTARRAVAKADIGTGMELDVITAVVLGGCSIFGGKGSVWGTLLGVLLIHEVREFVSWQFNLNELNLIVTGVLLVISVLADSLLSRRQAAHK